MGLKENNQPNRVLKILQILHSGKNISYDLLKKDSLWISDDMRNYGMPLSDKSMERDIKIVMNFLKENGFKTFRRKNENGYMEFGVANKKIFENFWHEDSLRVFGLIYDLIGENKSLQDIVSLDEKNKVAFEKLKQDSLESYIFLSRPFEDLQNREILKTIEKAIKNKRKLKIKYSSNSNGIFESVVVPYYIVFMSENFYLVCYTDKDELIKARVKNIKEIELLKDNFKKDLNLDKFIKNMQSPFAKYETTLTQNLVKVVLKVDKQVAHYFNSKKFFSSQTILNEKNKNGDIFVQYNVTQSLELLHFVLKWCDSVEVLEPLELRDMVKNKLKQAIKKYED